MMKQTNQIFVSYSHKDQKIADEIVHKLEDDGFSCWYAPRNIEPGEEWADSIVKAIKNSSIMVLIFTDYSNASKQVVREVETAINNGVIVIPFKLTAKNPTGAMEYYLSTLHWLDAQNIPLNQSIDNLIQLINNIKVSKHNKSVKTNKNKKLIIGTVFVLLLVLLTFIVYFIRNRNISRLPAIDFSKISEASMYNNGSPEGQHIVYDEENDFVYYTNDILGIYGISKRDFLNNYTEGKLEHLTNAKFLEFTNNHIIYSNYDYLHVYDVNTKEDKQLNCFNSGYYLAADDWIIYVDLNDYLLKAITIDGEHTTIFEGISLSQPFPRYHIYNNAIYYIDNNNYLRKYENGAIEEVTYIITDGTNKDSFVIKPCDFTIVDSMLIYIDYYSHDIKAVDLNDNIGELTLISANQELHPIYLTVWNRELCFTNVSSDYKTEFCRIETENNNFSYSKIDNTDNIWFANSLDDLLYFRTATEIGDDQYEYRYNCVSK